METVTPTLAASVKQERTTLRVRRSLPRWRESEIEGCETISAAGAPSGPPRPKGKIRK